MGAGGAFKCGETMTAKWAHGCGHWGKVWGLGGVVLTVMVTEWASAIHSLVAGPNGWAGGGGWGACFQSWPVTRVHMDVGGQILQRI